MTEDKEVSNTSLLLAKQSQSEVLTDQDQNNNSDTHISEQAATSTYHPKEGNAGAHSTEKCEEASALNEVENVAASDSNFQRRNTPSREPIQYLQDDTTESTKESKVSSAIRLWDTKSKCIASEDNTSKTNNLQRKNSSIRKVARHLQDSLEKVLEKTIGSTGNDTSQAQKFQSENSSTGKLDLQLISTISKAFTNPIEHGIDKTEKSNVPNEMPSNDANIKTSGTALSSTPPPPLPPLTPLLAISQKRLEKTMESTGNDTSQTENFQRENSSTGKLDPQLINTIGKVFTYPIEHGIGKTEKSNVPSEISFNDTSIKTSGTALSPPPPPPPLLSSFKLVAPQNSTKSDTSTNIKIDTKVDAPMQLKVCGKAGISTIIEINTLVDTEIEIRTNPIVLCIQPKNEDIISYNYYTDSLKDDSAVYDGLSGSASNSSCYTESDV